MANTTETVNLCGLKREDFQTTINGKTTVKKPTCTFLETVRDMKWQSQTMEVPFVLLWFLVRMAK